MRLEPLYSVTIVLRPQAIGATPEGTRMDVEFEGDLDPGGRVAVHLKGVDYLTVGQDGVVHPHIHGVTTSPEGDVVAVHATGLGVPASDGTHTIRFALTFQTASSKLAWLNGIVAFAAGKADLNKGELTMSAYTLEE